MSTSWPALVLIPFVHHRFISTEPHQAGSNRDEELAEFYKNALLDYGLDRVYTVPYKVLLSYADASRPNKVYVLSRGEPLLISQHHESPVRPEEMPSQAVPAYHSFSPSGDVTGQPVYVNYGRVQDFELLEDAGRVDVRNKVCIVRYGKAYRGSKVANAERFGCIGVIMFSDPSLIAPFSTEPESVYPHSIWMNGRTMQRGNVRMVSGDANTPGYAAVPGWLMMKVVRPHVNPVSSSDGYHDGSASVPGIPSQPIGYDDAKSILS